MKAANPDRRWRQACVIGVAAACMNGGVVFGRQIASVDAADVPVAGATPELAALEARVARLGDAELSTREAATIELANDPSVTTRMIESFLIRPEISEEQRARLTTIGLSRFRGEPRAAMGVSFDRGSALTQGVTIRGAIEGFDAVRVLQPGDVILSINGQPVRNDGQARIAILSHDPGDVLELRIQRRGEALVANVALGFLRDLRDGPSLDPVLIRRLWEYRLDRVARASAKNAGVNRGPIEPGIDEARWEAIAEAIRSVEEATDLRANAVEVESNGPVLAAGGSARAASQESLIKFSATMTDQLNTTQGLQAQADLLAEQMRSLQVRWMDPKLRNDDRVNLRATYELLRRRHADLLERIRKQSEVIER